MPITHPFLPIVIVLSLLHGNAGIGFAALEEKSSDQSHPVRPKSSTLESTKSKKASVLRMSRAVACRSIDGYEQYEPLGDVGLTSDEKLLVYYRPQGYKVVRRNSDYVVHFSQDGKIRRKGEKAVLRYKRNLLDLETPFKTYPGLLFLRNTVSLKDLPPGVYEFEIILRDENAPGQTITQTLEFRIVQPEKVGEDGQSSSVQKPETKRAD